MGICSACTGLLLCIRPIFMEVFLLKNNTKKLLCILLAIAAAVCVIFACFMLTKHKQTDSASSAAASDAYFEHLAKQDLILQAVAETKSLAPTQEELDDANSTYADTYGENRAHLNALQSCVLDWLEENSTVA